MTTDSMHCPKYVAMVAENYLESDDNLDALLALLRKLHDPDAGEDICIWREDRTIAAVMRADGTISVFEQTAPAEPPRKPANGRGRGRRR